MKPGSVRYVEYSRRPGPGRTLTGDLKDCHHGDHSDLVILSAEAAVEACQRALDRARRFRLGNLESHRRRLKQARTDAIRAGMGR